MHSLEINVFQAELSHLGELARLAEVPARLREKKKKTPKSKFAIIRKVLSSVTRDAGIAANRPG